MTWVTVCWHPGAEEDLAELWLKAEDRGIIERAANEIDQLLRYLPSRKGSGIPVGTLDPESIDVLQGRLGAIPEVIRWVRCGPLEVLFTAHEADRQARVWLVRPTEFGNTGAR